MKFNQTIPVFFIFLFITSNSLFAQCPSSNITLTTQGEIDAFLTEYMNCIHNYESITISGDNITNLDALSHIISIETVLIIQNNPLLESLDPLFNVNLSTVASMTIINNPLLNECNIQNFCEYLFYGNELTIYDNGPFCSLDAMITACIIGCNPGSTCDDGNDNTIFDSLDENCNCAGIVDEVQSLCGEVVVEVTNDDIYVSGLNTTPLSILEIFEFGGTKIYGCDGDCTRTEGLLDVPDGRYSVRVVLLDANGDQVCETEKFINVDNTVIIQGPDPELELEEGRVNSYNRNQLPPAINKTIQTSSLSVFPNPAIANNKFNIQLSQLEKAHAVLSIYDSFGRLIATQKYEGINDVNYEFDLTGHPVGMYIINLELEGQQIISEKLIVIK